METGRTLTGAWIETEFSITGRFDLVSHPHGCVD